MSKKNGKNEEEVRPEGVPPKMLKGMWGIEVKRFPPGEPWRHASWISRSASVQAYRLMDVPAAVIEKLKAGGSIPIEDVEALEKAEFGWARVYGGTETYRARVRDDLGQVTWEITMWPCIVDHRATDCPGLNWESRWDVLVHGEHDREIGGEAWLFQHHVQAHTVMGAYRESFQAKPNLLCSPASLYDFHAGSTGFAASDDEGRLVEVKLVAKGRQPDMT